MCGIAGFSTSRSSEEDSTSTIERMLSAFAYRGPDAEAWVSNSVLFMGHRRLSIIDPSGGSQPCINEQGDILIYNGEIYGYKEIADTLRNENISVRGGSDTEVLFSLLNTKGVEATLELIDGMFAFAYYASREKKLYLVRDRFGEKPLFYCFRKNQLVFASEIKALRQHPLGRAAKLDSVQISNFLLLEYLPGSMSGYDHINKLLPGQYLCFDPEQRKIDIQEYSGIDFGGDDGDRSEVKKLEYLEYFLSDSVRKRLVSDVPLGVFLSGGVDSSLIAALAQKHSGRIKSYTIKMPGFGFDESPYAERCAKLLDLDHTTIGITVDDVCSGVDEIAEKLDEPLADSSLIPSYLLCKYSKRYVTVALGGDGADELFAGYPNFKAQQLAPLMSYIPEVWGRLFRRALQYIPANDKYMSSSFRYKQLSYGFGMPIEQQSNAWMAAWFSEEQRDLWRPGYRRAINDGLAAYVTNICESSNSSHRMNRLMYLFMSTYLPDDILVKMDRASMYASLEVRSPFLAREFVNYVVSLPRIDKIRLFSGKYLLKKFAVRHLPESIVNRKKHGFGFPISAFIRSHFRERVGDTILNSKNPLMDWFEPMEINRYWNEHQSGLRDHGKKLWALYVAMNIANK